MLPDRDLPTLPALGLWVAAGAGALSLVAFRRPRQPWRQWSCPVPCAGDRLQRGFRVLGGNSTVFQRFPVRTAGRCRASRLRGPVRALVAAPGWRGGAPPLAVSPAHRSRSRRPATPATNSRTLPPRKAPRKPGPVLLPPLPGRSGVTGILVSVTPDGAAPASNGRQRRPCRLLPCAAGFVQNPSSECPTTRLQSGTKHYGVYLANHDARAVLTRLESWR